MQTRNILPGQRWISNAESDLGLGTVLKVEDRNVTLLYPAVGETRTYAIHSAPLTRLRFAAGDLVSDHRERRIRITEAREVEGLLHYRGELSNGEEVSLSEGELNDHLRIATPQRRLATGRLDKPRWFELRKEALEQLQQVESSPVRGLVGARVEPLPHQLYIAHEVSRRHAPRVLLADEVGLGKTIEAGLILHAMIHQGKVRRALIIVPDSLIHQWFIELARRFNLNFSILDEERCRAISDSGQHHNPFLGEQLALCPLGLFEQFPGRCPEAIAGEWDMLVVDEAHHLEWTTQAASPQYQLVESLAHNTAAVLLLTATPEQLGSQGHFARLRLLDPHRFHDLETFAAEESGYAVVAQAVELLAADGPVEGQQLGRLLGEMGETPDPQQLEEINGDGETGRQARLQLIDSLLDRHGTGRILFRNSRAGMQGFPERIPLPYPLDLPEEYAELAADIDQPEQLLTPEALYRSRASRPWQGLDPRIGLLLELCRRYPDDKILVICAHRETAQQIADTMTLREGVAAALFHEQLSLVERDRAAAWFADHEESGARLLICSEIGSEGRNFQFARHLLLFDLPLNPDLLEQRIGRLDRIGQKHAIRIHIPYFSNSPQQALYRWYEEALNAFRHPCPVAGIVTNRLAPMLVQALEKDGDETLAPLLESARAMADSLREEMHRGRDRLLERNSCRPEPANELVEEVLAEDAINRSLQIGLPGLLDRLLTLYGVESEEHSLGSWIFRPGAHMAVDHFPGIPDDGITCTYHRETALAHEDRQFLTWEHPLVRGGLAMLLDDERGTSSAGLIQHPSLKGGRLLLEFLFQAECVAPRGLRPGRFLPPTLIHRLIDQDLQEMTPLFDDPACKIRKLDPMVAVKIIQALEARIRGIFEQGEQLANAALPPLIDEACSKMESQYDQEIQRLTALARVNGNVRPEELAGLERERTLLHKHLHDARLRLDSVRMLISA
jgi:ATP-dependent helicase HepA